MTRDLSERAWRRLELARVQLKSGEAEAAFENARASHEIYRQCVPERDYHIAESEACLGLALLATNRPEEAAPRLESGYAELRRIRGAHSPKTQQARRALVQLYSAANKPDLAAKYEADAYQPAAKP